MIIVGNRNKVNKLESLRVDTGDFEVDKLLCGRMKAIIAYKEEMVMEVEF